MNTCLKSRDVYRLDINSKFLGINPRILMENAGSRVADYVEDIAKQLGVLDTVVICGLGNNGGDGFVTARHLASRRFNVTVVVLGDPSNIRSGEARENWQLLSNLILNIKQVVIKDATQLDQLENILSKAKVVIDAILGVGVKGAVKGFYGKVIELINRVKDEKRYIVVSVDVPSGLDVDEGLALGPLVKADYIVTFHALKHGLNNVTGEIKIAKIGIPREAEVFCGPGDLIYFREFLWRRREWSHKGDYGRILIIGGSKYYSGAPALAALSALKVGVDLAIIACPDVIANVIRAYAPNIIVHPVDGEIIRKKHVEGLIEFSKKFDAIIVGPGLGLDDETLEAIYEYIVNVGKSKPLVIDADALKALSKRGLPKEGIKAILTPHEGEFKILFGDTELSKDPNIRGNIVKRKAGEYGLVIVLKGHIDVVSDGIKTKLNMTGNPGMTVGGTGDVLSGCIGAFLSQKPQLLFESAVAGTFLTGFSGDLAFKDLGYSLTATDVIEYIPKALAVIREKYFS